MPSVQHYPIHKCHRGQRTLH